jgi:uncharacterized protein YutE (UPF0331/DUF86 family)
MIYQVNIKRIEEQLAYLEQCINVLKQINQIDTIADQFALARALHIGVECMIDVGSVMIDGFYMRDPGGYIDIVEILRDEKVVSSDLAEKIIEKVKFRDRLVRYYTEISKEELLKHAHDDYVFAEFIRSVNQYLDQERAKGNI